MRCRGKNGGGSARPGHAGGKESETAGRTGVGMHLKIIYFNFLTQEQDNGSIKHYTKLMIS